MVFRKLRFASSRCSAGELTLGELASVLWESEESPLVNKLGRVAMIKKLTGRLLIFGLSASNKKCGEEGYCM